MSANSTRYLLVLLTAVVTLDHDTATASSSGYCKDTCKDGVRRARHDHSGQRFRVVLHADPNQPRSPSATLTLRLCSACSLAWVPGRRPERLCLRAGYREAGWPVVPALTLDEVPKRTHQLADGATALDAVA